MAGTRRQSEDESTDSGSWIVTFSDCMTLLLCFFVLLLSFSSFDEDSKARLTGAFNDRTWTSILKLKQTPKDAVIKPVQRPFDWTDKGSEQPTDDTDLVKNPKNPFLLQDNDAFHDRRVFRLPIEKMFWGNGTSLKTAGRSYLDLIATFAKKMPCLIVVGQSFFGGSEDAELALQRACTVIRYLTETGGLPARRFSIAATPSSGLKSVSGPALEITLLARSIYE